jgi:NAD(P)-dependent dehydrogenase (short-subunit alcohol dehydrogenase family)
VRQEGNSIPSYKVWLKPLAAPDVLDFDLPEKHICIVTDDGSSLSMALAKRLRTRGWRVVVLRYYGDAGNRVEAYDEDRVGFDETALVTLTSDGEDHIRQQIEFITSRYGPIGAFIHMHPHCASSAETTVMFDPYSESVLRQLFFTAKYLQPLITASVQPPVPGTRACFMTVTQLDGGFGLYGERDIDVIAGGLSGLTKTLALEWPNVYCRAVDVSPEVNKEAVEYILAELNDPNRRTIEVGWHKMGRMTPEVQLYG